MKMDSINRNRLNGLHFSADADMVYIIERQEKITPPSGKIETKIVAAER